MRAASPAQLASADLDDAIALDDDRARRCACATGDREHRG
jgi:hypothetical protein